MIKNITLITLFRYNNNKSRLKNLRNFLQYYRPIFENIYVVEQDTTPFGFREGSLNYIFTYNSSAFNRSWGFNVGAMESIRKDKTDGFFFCDIDVLVDIDAINRSVALLNKNMVAVNPYSSIDHLDEERVEDFNCNGFSVCKPPNGTNPSFAGGAIFISKPCFLDIKGWNEEFRGWGGEDNAMSYILHKKYPDNVTSVSSTAIHLYHAPDFKGQLKKGHDFYQNNLDICKKISQRNIDEFIKEIDIKQIGNKNKYK